MGAPKSLRNWEITSHVARQNFTIRMAGRRFTRFPIAFVYRSIWAIPPHILPLRGKTWGIARGHREARSLNYIRSVRLLANILLWLSGFALGATVVYQMLHECYIDSIDLHVSTYGGVYFLAFLVLWLLILRRSRNRTASSN